jgi:hypothetical protein
VPRVRLGWPGRLLQTAALARVDEEASGLASGLLSTSVQIGGALGLAILVGVVSQRSSDLVGAGWAPLAAQVAGLQLAFLLAAAVSLAAALVAALALGRPKADAIAAGASSAREASS